MELEFERFVLQDGAQVARCGEFCGQAMEAGDKNTGEECGGGGFAGALTFFQRLASERGAASEAEVLLCEESASGGD